MKLKPLSQRIKEYRIKRNLTQVGFAHIVHVDQRTIQNAEAGKSMSDLTTGKIERVLQS
jgi:DNA-binding XRE family transcriptional regulator